MTLLGIFIQGRQSSCIGKNGEKKGPVLNSDSRTYVQEAGGTMERGKIDTSLGGKKMKLTG